MSVRPSEAPEVFAAAKFLEFRQLKYQWVQFWMYKLHKTGFWWDKLQLFGDYDAQHLHRNGGLLFPTGGAAQVVVAEQSVREMAGLQHHRHDGEEWAVAAVTQSHAGCRQPQKVIDYLSQGSDQSLSIKFLDFFFKGMIKIFW